MCLNTSCAVCYVGALLDQAGKCRITASHESLGHGTPQQQVALDGHHNTRKYLAKVPVEATEKEQATSRSHSALHKLNLLA